MAQTRSVVRFAGRMGGCGTSGLQEVSQSRPPLCSVQPPGLGLLLLMFPGDIDAPCGFGKEEPNLMSLCCPCLPLHPKMWWCLCKGNKKHGQSMRS